MSRSPYTVGMKVRIRPDLTAWEHYDAMPGVSKQGTASEMVRHAGKVATIVNYDHRGRSHSIDLDGGEWNWSDGMFVPIEFTKEELLHKYIQDGMNDEQYKTLSKFVKKGESS